MEDQNRKTQEEEQQAEDARKANEKSKERLRANIVLLEEYIAKKEALVENEKARLRATGADETASEIVNRHIRYLHRYNEMRDSGLGMLSLLAENKGLTLAQIYKERGMNETVELWFPG